MSNKEIENKIRLFTIANSLAENHLDSIEEELDLDLGRKEKEEIKEKEYYLQFDSVFRKEAKEMGKHYEIFYCLERSIRSLIVELMEEEYGENWWDEMVKSDIKTNVENNIQRETDSVFTQRSEYKIDYTTFGELSEIVKTNWDAFDDLFRSKRAFQKIMTSLNFLRGLVC